MSGSGLLPCKITPPVSPATEKLYHTPGPYNGLPKAWIGHKIQMKIMGGKSIHAYFRLAHRKWPGRDGHG
jgi:hypothetical protein